MIEIAVVVVTYNGAPWIRGCLDSLRASDVRCRVVLVDNCSDDDTLAIVSAEYPEVDCMPLTENLGFGRGNNLGIGRALELGSQYIFLLNQDAYVTPRAMGQLASFMDTHSEFGVASPLHCSPDVDHLDPKSFLGYLQRHCADWLCDSALGRCAPHYHIYGINAAAWFVRSDVFSQVGGFDPLFFMYGEDDDLLNRFAEHRVGFALLPSARIVHLRESPPRRPPSGFWDDIKSRASRQRSILLTRIKRANFSTTHMLLQLLAHGILMPLADLLIERDGRQFLSIQVATLQLISEMPAVRRHAHRCSTVGPHFLGTKVVIRDRSRQPHHAPPSSNGQS